MNWTFDYLTLTDVLLPWGPKVDMGLGVAALML